jgi:ketosteroid isomerase-like protein
MDNRHVDRIHELDDSWKAAAQRRDLDAMMQIYDLGAEELLPGVPPLVGREAIRSFYAELIERFPRFKHDFFADSTIVSASGDLAVVRGRFRFTPDAEAPHVVQVGKYIGVWQRRGGEWRLRYNISNRGQ